LKNGQIFKTLKVNENKNLEELREEEHLSPSILFLYEGAPFDIDDE
jgi:hypothetical protein